MSRRRGPRYLIVGEDRFVWSRGHVHERVDGAQGVPGYLDCGEVVTIRRDGSRGRLDVVFRAGEDHIVSDGLLPGGAVRRGDGRMLNLNEPGVVRALLDEALAGGWQADLPGRAQIDGWALFDAVVVRRSGPRA